MGLSLFQRSVSLGRTVAKHVRWGGDDLPWLFLNILVLIIIPNVAIFAIPKIDTLKDDDFMAVVWQEVHILRGQKVFATSSTGCAFDTWI
jgi:hypothetical protein